MVDKWSVDYEENEETGEYDLSEKYCGATDIMKTKEQKYLGFVLSSTGDNMANIREIKKKSIGTVKSTLKKLDSLKLGRYYFECSIILLKVMIRSSILYASETYYDMKEMELRQLERIEEGYMRQVLNTTKGCPIIQMYLTLGVTPARFGIQKIRLLFLKSILEEEDSTLLSKFFKLQLRKPSKGDWASKCIRDLKELEIQYSLQEIKVMSKMQFTNILNQKINENAFKYLMKRKGSKGKETIEEELCMAEYMLPTNSELSISEKQKMFAVKNRMVDIPGNFPRPNIEYKCICNKKEDMKHVYNCELINGGKEPEINYEKIFSGTIYEQNEVYKKFERNLEKREELQKNQPPCDPNVIHCSQLSLVMD